MRILALLFLCQSFFYAQVSPVYDKAVEKALFEAALVKNSKGQAIISDFHLLNYKSGGVFTRFAGDVTFLHLAVLAGSSNLIKALIKAGLAVDSKNNENQTPLHWATIEGRLKIVEELLELGANPDLVDIKKRTPLWFSAYYGHSPLCLVFLNFGADATIKGLDGDNLDAYTPEEIARRRGYKSTAELIKSAIF